ncbi:MAG TPA: pyridoxamine 5'-phosphate oxidase family protein [Solirubrobacterales bacterium]|nr:pyridoxamine 5'-phosphate oxidase family protein [Solirubrobacterales bacterium]
MGKVYDGIDDHQRDWIARQALFFVGSAPLDGEGHVNVSPKGPIGTLRVLDDHTVAYLDMTGSGAETVSHLRENGRIVVMLCAFDGPPRILRLHGRGEVINAWDSGFEELFERAGFEAPHEVTEAQRAIVLVDVTRVADSCGYGVPLMSYEGERPHMEAWAEKKMQIGGDAISTYVTEKNKVSIDGLPAFDAGVSSRQP